MPLLEVVQATKRFGGVLANESVDLGVSVNEIVVIIGPNGAGKTTLFNLISGYYRPDSGRILFDGREIQGMPAHVINRAGIARTFQKLRLFLDMSVLENTTVAALPRSARLPIAQERARSLLEAVGLQEHGHKPAGALSTGQRKRLEIARALATNPQILLLDEPLAGIDPEGVSLMIELIHSLRDEDLTLVIIEHNMRAAVELADRFVALHLGQKIAEGKPQDVVMDDAVIAAYLGHTYVAR